MLFNSIDFAIFLPIVFVLYWFVTNRNLKLQNAFLILVSYIFYGWWDWRFLSLIAFSSVVDFLVGQEELRQTVLIPELEQLHQRIVAACHLTPLTSDSTAAYIKHRLGRVGWDNDPELSDKIFEPIYRYSLGIPRIVNQICSRLLLHGMVEEKHKLGLEDVREVIDSLNEEQLLPIPA